MLIKACLNGDRKPDAHPALPVSPDELARDARRVVEAGAGALHIHPRDAGGSETLEAGAIGAALVAVRAACPGVPVGISTGAWIEPSVEHRLALVRNWRVQPDFASVNLSEAGAAEVCAVLQTIGVGIEAGIWSPEDAQLLLDSGLAEHCLRILIEPIREQTLAQALATTETIERVLDGAGVRMPRLLHGADFTAWPILDTAIARGYDIRIGLEDTLVMPDGSLAQDNARMVAEAWRRTGTGIS